MAPVLAYTLPAMQLVCNLVMTGDPVWNDTSTSPTVNQTTPEIPPAGIPEGYVAYPDIGVAYKVVNTAATWKVAREKCLAEGARLAVTDSFIKFEAMMSRVPASRSVFVGIRSMYDHTEWVSDTDGSTLVQTAIPWAPGYPSGTKTCVLAYSNPRGLQNYACSGSATTYYACEIPISSKPIKQKSLVAEISAK